MARNAAEEVCAVRVQILCGAEEAAYALCDVAAEGACAVPVCAFPAEEAAVGLRVCVRQLSLFRLVLGLQRLPVDFRKIRCLLL